MTGGISTATLLGMISAVGFGLAAVLALCAVVTFFVLDIKGVRDEMTGRTAEREIAHMRSTTWAVRRSRERSARRLITGMDADDALGHVKLRTVGGAPASVASEDATTLEDDGATTLEDDGATTLEETDSAVATGSFEDATTLDDATTFEDATTIDDATTFEDATTIDDATTLDSGRPEV